MKKLSILLFSTALFLFSACEGPIGPPGLDGESFLGTVFERSGDFEAPNYDLYFEFPTNFEIYETDVVLAYMLWEQDNGLKVWRLLPQTIVLPEDGLIQYNFDYTLVDVRIFMEGTPDQWIPADTDNHLIRIVVFPADFIAQKSININDLGSMLQAPNLKLNTITDISFSE